MTTPKRVGLLTGIGVLLVLAIVASALVVTVRAPFPAYAGTVEVPGLGREVLVLRDRQGVPQIYADDPADLFYAQGYVTAQDRFYDMDVQRHTATGELSALLGSSGGNLDSDVMARSIGFERIARQELPLLSPRTRDFLQAYADGVNAYLADRNPGEVSAAYLLPRVRVSSAIRPWTPLDSLTWLKAMQWQQESDLHDDLGRTLTYAHLGDPDLITELDPAADPTDPGADPAVTPQTGPAVTGGPVPGVGRAAPVGTVPASARGDGMYPVDPAIAVVARREAALSARLAPAGEPGGGTAVAVGPARSATGHPLLAQNAQGQPVLPGPWYPIGLHCRQVGTDCPFDVSGLSRPAFPAVLAGHNDSLAWAPTRLDVDVTDLVMEDVVDGAAARAGAREPVTSLTETIRVADGPDVRITVPPTVHGPVLSDPLPGSGESTPRQPAPGGIAFGGSGYDVALVWTGLWPGRTAQAVFDLSAARSASDLRSAVALYDGPTTGFVYADGAGTVGYEAAGRVPTRPTGPGLGRTDGAWPRPGWDPGYDWTGLVAAQTLHPAVTDPASGIVLATNRGGFALGGQPEQDLQAQALAAALEAGLSRSQTLNPADLTAAQADTHDLLAEDLVPLLQAIPPSAQSNDNLVGFAREGVDLFADWDRRQSTDSAAAAYYNAVYGQLLRDTFDDQLPPGFRPDGSARWAFVLHALLQDPDSPWWDDVTTPTIVETRDQIISQALVTARLQLTTELGKRADRWQWGQAHAPDLQQPNVAAGAGSLTGPVGRIADADPVPLPGSAVTATATGWDPQRGGFAATNAPVARTVVDLGAPDKSTWVVLGGNSGHPWSAGYNVQTSRWQQDDASPWLFSEPAVDEAAVKRLTLRPEPPPEPTPAPVPTP